MKRRSFLAGTLLASMFGHGQVASAATPWYNWSGHLAASPRNRLRPKSEAELAEMLLAATPPIRPVGSGHSFSPLVPTDGSLVTLDWISGLTDSDQTSLTATFGAGTRLSDMGPALQGIGQAPLNLPDIDRQTVAGAIATATHGTGQSLGGLSAYVSAMKMATVDGEILTLSAGADQDLFNAARVSLGALGVVTEVTMQNRLPYRLKARSEVISIEDALDNFAANAASHRHYELFPFLYSDYTIALTIDETTDAIHHPPIDPAEDAQFQDLMTLLMSTPAIARQPIIDTVVSDLPISEVVDESHRILANIRNTRFNEMEYSVAAEAGADCLREILSTVRQQKLDVVFPLEYRYVAADDTWLGMHTGKGVFAAISIHQLAGVDYSPYFDVIEPIFWKYDGRPHWGKVHSLKAADLRLRYPRFDDFQTLRQQLDPEGKLLNQHLRQLLLG